MNTEQTRTPKPGRTPSRSRHKRRHRGNRSRHGNPRRTVRTEGFDMSSIMTPPSTEKFYTEENLQDIAFGFQDPEQLNDEKMKQIYGIIHGQLGVVDIPENKDDYAGVRGEIVYYCKDCEKLVEPKKHPKRQYVFLCGTCGGEHVCWGTEQGVSTHFHIRTADGAKPIKRDLGN